jgi:hypothetical protein
MGESVSTKAKAERPEFPADYGVPKAKKGMLAWEQVGAWLAAARVYWIVTVRPDGRPHARPIWGMWVEDRFYFDGAPETRWARNLETNPAISVHIEQGAMVAIVEGSAERMSPGPELGERLMALSKAKYGYSSDMIENIFMVRPSVAYAWDESLKGATRWRFPGEGEAPKEGG